MPFISAPVRQIVGRYLTGRTGFTRVVTLFSVLGIMLGVAALIVVMTVMNGFRDELLTRVLGLSGHGTVYVRGLTIDGVDDAVTKLKTIDDVTTVTPFISGQGMALSNRGAAGGFVRGLRTQDIPTLIQEGVVSGDIASLTGNSTVALGKRLADTLGVKAGDRITLVAPDGAQTVVGFIPRMMPLRVAAVFNVGMFQYDEGLMLTNMATAQRFYRMGDRITGLDLEVLDPTNMSLLRVNARDALDVPLTVTTWQETNREFFGALEVERVSMFIILSLIVLVAAFNIITGQMMLVGDKRTDIGILRTLGATAKDIQRIFLLNGLVLGGVGTFGGACLGLSVVSQLSGIIGAIESITGAQIFSGEAYFLDEIPQSLVWSDVGIILLISLMLTLLASVLPARRASKIAIVEALRD